MPFHFAKLYGELFDVQVDPEFVEYKKLYPITASLDPSADEQKASQYWLVGALAWVQTIPELVEM
jgi:hypothetical protein